MKLSIVSLFFITSSVYTMQPEDLKNIKVVTDVKEEKYIITSVITKQRTEALRRTETTRTLHEIIDDLSHIDPSKQTQENKALGNYVTYCIQEKPNQLHVPVPGTPNLPLHYAAMSDYNNSILTQCLERKESRVDACTSICGVTALMLAADYIALKNGNTLLRSGASTIAMDNYNQTALHHICSPTLDSFDANKIAQRFSMADAILTKMKERNEDINLSDKLDKSALDYVATTYYGNLGSPANHPLSADQFTLFNSQRKALMSLLLRNGADAKPTIATLKQKLESDPALNFLEEFKDHLENPNRSNCNLN